MKEVMRRTVLFAAIVAMALPAMGARRVTVEQLRQLITAQQAASKSDGDTASKLASLELTERLSVPTLSKMKGELKPGPKTEQALDLLADCSSFLPPPDSELPATAKPDMAAQRAMINGAMTYIAGTLRHLPDFLATRVTRSFDDSPLVVGHSGYAPGADLHLVGSFSRVITYRNGREVPDSEAAAAGGKQKPAAGPAGLSSWGEFGPVLAVVLTDMTKGKVTWSRWESASTGEVAVYHFTVPKDASHFVVDYCCIWKSLNDVRVWGSQNDQRVAKPQDDRPASYRGTPAYHGDLTLDPATGAILRVTVEAELASSDLIARAVIAVQYDKVDIGGQSYLCPVRSVAISADRNRPGGVAGESTLTRVNEVSFTDYHRFGTQMRMLPDTTDKPAPSAGSGKP